MGDKKKPRELKKTEGTDRKDRESKAPPANEYGLPDCPTWLSKAGKSAYKDLAKDLERMGVVAKEDKHMLSIVCEAFGELVDLKKTLQKEGQMYETTTDRGSKVMKKRPEAELANAKEKFVADKLTEFGLSPASRNKVERIDTSETQDELESYLSKSK